MELSEHAARNRAYWDATADEYQAQHAQQLNQRERVWGLWGVPEDELQVLGDVFGKDVLELGCGAAQWSIFLAKQGARPVGLDNSERQLAHARELMAAHGVDFPLVHASAETVPLPDASFDIVFCDHGALSFTDPFRTVPEVARLLRPGGLLAFNLASPWVMMCVNPTTDALDETLHTSYFGMHRFDWPDSTDFQLPYGEWVRLLRANGFAIEDLIELRPPADASSTYAGYPLEWCRQWPAENIWKVRKLA
jgi:SAM-dependent methyltransferase